VLEFSIAIRWIMLVSASALLGALTLMLLSGKGGGAAADQWRGKLQNIGAVLIAGWIAFSFVALGVQAAAVTGHTEAAWTWREWRHVLENTRFGAIWMLRLLVGLSLLVLLLWQRRRRMVRREGLIAAWVLAVIVQCAAAWSGHGAALEPAVLGLGAVAAHLLCAGIWAGALPWLVLGFGQAAHANASSEYKQWMRSVLVRFSALATVGVLVILASGTVMTYLLVEAPKEWPARAGDWLAGASTVLERVVAPLLSTRFGTWVLIKIGLFLIILWLASGVRWRDLPRIASGNAQSWAGARRSVLLEALVVAALLCAAAIAASSIPAAHDTMVWPLPFRVSMAATWSQPNVPMWFALASFGLVIALVIGARPWVRLLTRKQLEKKDVWRAILGAGSMLAATGTMLWLLAVPAYPETYLKSDVAYDAVSIARGAGLYPRHCAQCHGVGAHGDGPLATKLAKRPADLSQPHTALHTAGDIFHWITYGIANSPMPGFRGITTDDDRWDLVNFLRLFSSGHQARILTPRVVQGQPWLGAPNFDYVDAQSISGSLKELRGHVVLLVFYTLPTSQKRFAQLVALQARMRERGVEVVAVPLPGSQAADAASLPFILPVDGAAEIARAYLLLRRTKDDAGRTVADEVPAHMEFLIDRFGYVRARWVDVPKSQEWRDEGFLLRQIELLNEEPRLMPSPDDHVH
jgi:putative copper resistance protein D